MSMITEKVFEAIKTLPDQDAAKVLDFVEALQAGREGRYEQAKQQALAMLDNPPLELSGRDEEKPVTEEEHAAWCERLRRLVESQPMTEGDTVAKMRQEARY